MANTHSLDLEASSSQYAYITDANQTGLDITGDISMEAWIKLETTGTNQVIMGKWGPNIRQYLINIKSTNQLSVQFSDNGSESVGHIVNFTTNNAVIADTGVWYHIAVTFDISEEICLIYINGESVANTKTGSIGSNLYNGTANFLIGQQNNAEYFDGLIDEVRVWNDVRTSTEIADNYQKELVGNEAGLVGYWKFNDSALDETSNNNDLTLSGSPSYSSDVPVWGLTRNLISYWKLDSNAKDSVSSNDLTISGATATASGKINGAYDFDGTNDYLYRNAFSSLGKSGTYTYSLWFYANTIDATQILLKNNLASDDRNVIGISAAGDICVGYYDGTTTRGKSKGSTITADTWYHVVFVKSGTTVTGYLNGTVMTGSNGPQYSNETGFALGGKQDTSFHFDGIIDEVGLWSRALTSTEVTELYNSGSGLQYPFITAYTLVVDKMALALTYADVTLKKAIKLVVDTMALSFTFADVIFNNARTLIVDTMALSLTYADVTLKKAVKLVVDTMSLILDFKNVILKKIGWNNDTKPSDTWTEDTKPSDTWTNDSK